MPSDLILHQDTIRNFYQAHHAWLKIWLKRKLACHEEAADIAQDTLMKVVFYADFTNILEPRAFLTTTATRLLIDKSRKRKIEQSYLNTLEISKEVSCASPEQIREAIETLNEIASMLEGLPENVYRAFLMFRLEGMQQSDIANILGVSTGMVKQYIARAMIKCCQYKIDA